MKKKNRTKVQTVAIILVCDFFLGSATFCAPNLNSTQTSCSVRCPIIFICSYCLTHARMKSKQMAIMKARQSLVNQLVACSFIVPFSLPFDYCYWKFFTIPLCTQAFFIRTALCFYKQMSIPQIFSMLKKDSNGYRFACLFILKQHSFF